MHPCVDEDKRGLNTSLGFVLSLCLHGRSCGVGRFASHQLRCASSTWRSKAKSSRQEYDATVLHRQHEKETPSHRIVAIDLDLVVVAVGSDHAAR